MRSASKTRIARGETLASIAENLNLSIQTVSTHRRRMLDKLQLNSNADLVRYPLDVLLLHKTSAARDLASARYQYAMARVRLLSLIGSCYANSIKMVNLWLIRKS